MTALAGMVMVKEATELPVVRCRHSTVFKYKHIVACQSYMDEKKHDSKPYNISDYSRNIFILNRMNYWMNNLSRWNNNKETIIATAGNQLNRRMVIR